ncbi:putative epoxide hydrolase [Cyphellophora attinorum]|uniref:Putative epoxide hydrolase n=1 Tax=Cyphellophora attinorum TaxID=1664694 RepID=A0A0N1H4R1_9EURO|nr:putative epoxide hydrolase [Phialophora attinorum]KPI40406.1 putative epoxide hydrolase [Phialophora attinorum]
MSVKVRPFTIEVPPDEVDRMKRKLRDTRMPKLPIGRPSLTHKLYNKFVNFDWQVAHNHIQRHQHFIATIPDENTTVDIHFTHTRSSNPDAIPLLLIHGWPGSFFEFDRVVDDLAKTFHVVVPNIPGFMWSSPPPRRGWTLSDTARLYNKLMHALGHTAYAAQAGDWGMFIARELGSKYTSSCKAVHLNFCPTPLPDNLESSDLAEREKRVEARCDDWLDNHLGYAVCMRSRPHTIGVAFADNPVAIMMWVGEKYLELAHPNHMDEKWWDDVLTTVCLYYFSGCIMTSMLPYFENAKHADFGTHVLSPANRITCPMGFTSYMYDSRPGTKRGVERSGNLVWYREVDEGGHFAALETPEGFVEDLRAFLGEHYHT